MKTYDLGVVGSGVGLTVLEEGIKRGLKCALVESGKIGGTCLNRGCIPSKILTVPADAIRDAEHARKIGVDLRLERLDWETVARRMWDKISENEEMEKALAEAPGLTLYRGTGEFTGKSSKIVTFEDVKTGQTGEADGEEILVAVGRRSNADVLQAGKTGVATDARGWIKADEYLETTIPGIWAIGDGIGGYQFRHKANYDSDICVHNLFESSHPRIPVDYSVVPWAVYTHPQVGHAGLTMRQALEAGHEIYVAIHRYSDVARGYALGYEAGDSDDGFVKLIVDKSFRILGAHVVGPQASILVQAFVYLMNAGYSCVPPEKRSEPIIPKELRVCPEAGSIMPIYRSMVIHPSLNEVAAWAIRALQPVNIRKLN